MNLDKVIKYSVPLFVLAIVSRSIEEISFVYYAVPVMCVLFTVLVFRSMPRIHFGIKGQKSMVKWEKDIVVTSTLLSRQAGSLSVTENNEYDIRNPASGIKRFFSLFSAKDGFRFAQHFPSSLFHFPFLLFLLPGLWFLLTSFWSSYPEISAFRALYFILISLGCISAGILWIRYSEKNIFGFLLPANAVVILISIFSLITNIPSDSWTAGHGKGFMGFFGHQNLLASVLLFTLPAVFDKIKDKSQNIKERKVFFILLLSLNLVVLALTYSRSAILSLIFGVIIFFILNKNWKVLLYSSAMIILFMIIIYSTPALNQFADKIIKKDFPEVYSSRLWMWEPSYQAALEGGLFGLGYGISHPEIRSGEYSDRFENDRLIREKGNSVLALIEEAGVVGLVLFLLPIALLLKYGCMNVWMFENQSKIHIQPFNHTFILTAIIAFIEHAQFEAWWVGVGSVQLPLFFIYIGILTKYQQVKFK